MFEKTFRVTFRIIACIGLVLCLTGVILFYAVGPGGGRMKDSYGNLTALYLNVFLLLEFVGIGLVFLLVSMIGAFILRAKTRKKKHLKENGRVFYARIISVKQNRMVTINGRHPYQIEAEYADELTKKTYYFKSEYMKEKVELPNERIDSVRVFVDRENYKRYYMDLSSILGNYRYTMEKQL